MTGYLDIPSKRIAQVSLQSDGAILLIVHDNGIRTVTEQIPSRGRGAAQPILERAAAVLERRGMRLARPWCKTPDRPFHFATAWERG